MENIINEDIYLSECLDVWGKDSQIKQCIEELGELISALARVDKKNRDHVVENIIEEIADVIVTTRQMQILFGKDEVNRIISEKISRTRKKLEKDKKP